MGSHGIVASGCGVRGHVNAQRSDTGWVTDRNRFPGRVVGRRSVVGMAPTLIVIRRSTDEGGTQTRVASARAGVLPWVSDGKNEHTMLLGILRGNASDLLRRF